MHDTVSLRVIDVIGKHRRIRSVLGGRYELPGQSMPVKYVVTENPRNRFNRSKNESDDGSISAPEPRSQK